ncbi:hypothetical protein [Microbacterium sp. 2FI]|uniref:hypothetical protein n=1 Tax=Microbacterium sp. 2FI TaxID=2502193 RepID=UPI0010F8D200|nr:hypothetical protein [Microbacterium sp. 2FI]
MSGHAPAQGGGQDAAALAEALTCRWVRGYTAWVGAEAAERRRAEIASDVWEQRADARERGAAPATAALSIAGRVMAGIPADLTWVRAQRLAMRGQRADRKALTMNTLGHIAARWWWVLGAAVLAGLGVVALIFGDRDLQRGQVGVTVAALVAGIVLRQFLPRTAACLIVFGAAIPAMLIWVPWVMIVGIATVIGAAIEVVRLTSGVAGRALAALGLVSVVGAIVWIAASGLSGPEGLGLWGPIVLAAAGIAVLVATGARRRPVAAA